MKAAFGLLALTSLVVAGPVPSQLSSDVKLLYPRQAKAAIINGLAKIGTGVDATTALVSKWDGKAATIDPIVASANNIGKDIQSATSAISAAPEVGLLEATSIIAPANQLDAKLQTLVTALVTNKGKVAAVGKTAVVKQALTEQRTNAQALAKAITGKMPALAGPVAEPLAQGFVTKLDSAVTAYS